MSSISPVSSMRLEPRRRKRKAGSAASSSTKAGLLGAARWHMRADWVASGFRQFGEHCARNQIRVLLIDCFVMTNLFYPALTLYLTKRYTPRPDASRARDGTFSLLSQPLLNSFFPFPPPLLPRLEVQKGQWWEDTPAEASTSWHATRYTPSQLRKGKMRAGVGAEDVVVMRVAWTTVERLLDGVVTDTTTQDQRMVEVVLQLADQWQWDVTAATSAPQGENEGCVRGWWDGNSCVSWPSDGETNYAQDGVYRTLSVLMRSRDASDGLLERWRDDLAERTATVGAQVFAESRDVMLGRHDVASQIWSLSLNTTTSSLSTLASPSTTAPTYILALYAVLILTLLRQLSDATKVHSRFGLAFTGVMELACSTVMSFSILGLLGWADVGSIHENERGLPVYMMPFVIVVVGVENMSTLTKAVFSIPFSYSVPDRIGLALAKVGATLTLTSLADMALLAVVGCFVNVRAIREFCLFAGIVIFVDWWMLHTFFLTVLSIDAQRLELADVLQSPDLPGKPVDKPPVREKQPAPEGSLKSIGTGFKAVIMGRTARSFSLILLLAFLSGLLYVTDSSRPSAMSTANLYGYWPSSTPTGSPTTTVPSSATTAQELADMSPAEQLWHAVNPAALPSINVVIPPATIIVLPTDDHVMRPIDLRKLSLPRSRIVLPRFKPLFSFIKIFILPQALTAGSLYLLLLYLLKDADLLDAQRHRLGRGEETALQLLQRKETALTSGMRFNLLPPEHQADIELLASSRDGDVVVSVDFDSAIRLWRAASDGTMDAFCEILMAPKAVPTVSDPIVQVAVDFQGTFVAAATSSGQLMAWRLRPGEAPEAAPLTSVNMDAKVCGLLILAPDKLQDDPFVETAPPKQALVLVALADGSALQVDETEASLVVPPIAEPARKVSLLQFAGSPRLLVSTQTKTTAWQRGPSGHWEEQCHFDSQPFTAVAGAEIELNGESRAVYAFGYRDSSIVVVDSSSGDVLDSVDVDEDTRGPIARLEIARPASFDCAGCGLSLDNIFHIIASTRQHVLIYKVFPRQELAICKCRTVAPRMNGIDKALLSPAGHMPRSDSALVLPPSPLRARATSSPGQQQLLVPSQGDFPVSGHGYTRRLSAMHREADDDSGLSSRSPLLRNSSTDFTSMTDSEASSPKWSDLNIESLGAIAATKGDWALVQNRYLVGVRRSGRSSAASNAEWQIWTVDLANAWDGFRLRADSVAIASLAAQQAEPERSSVEILEDPDDGPNVSLRHRRARRLWSLSGSTSGRSSGRLSSASLVRPPPLSYHTVWPVIARGQGLVAGFGNRLGVAIIPTPSSAAPPSSPGLTPRANASAYPFPSTPSTLLPPPPASGSRRASVNYSLAVPKSKQL